MCNDCAATIMAEKRATLKKTISVGFILFGVVIILGLIDGISKHNLDIAYLIELPVGAYMIAGIPNGWRALSKIQPSMFLFLPLVGWLIYFFIKFVLSVNVGLFVFPINIVTYFTEKKKLDELERYMHEQ